MSMVTGILGNVLGSASSGMTSYMKGKEDKATAYRQATYYERQGRLVTQKAEEERTQRSKELEQLYGFQRAKYSASGVTQKEGSPQEVIRKSMEEGNLELERIRYWGQQAAESYAITAYESRKAGRLAQKAGGYAALGSLFSGIAGTTAGVYRSIYGPVKRQETESILGG